MSSRFDTDPTMVFRRKELPFEALEAHPDIYQWEALAPDPNFSHQRGRYIIAVWQTTYPVAS